MQHIDFLPSRYRDQSNERRVKLWRLVVIALFGAGIGATALAQYSFRRAAKQQLAAIDEQHSVARAKTEQFTALQQQLKEVQSTTQLYAWLHHPWPRTQILAGVTNTLPDTITLSELRLIRETPPTESNDARRSRRPRGNEGTDEEAQAKLAPAVRDLKRLRDEYDSARLVVEVSGLSRDIAGLHTYASHLCDVPLFAKCELASLESVGDNRAEGKGRGSSVAQSKFKLRIVVRPGYGQPGSPTLEQETVARRE